MALYRGLPYDLPLGIKLYSEVYAAPVQVAAIPPIGGTAPINHTLRFHADAASLIKDLQAAAERRAAAHEADGWRSRRRRESHRRGGTARAGSKGSTRERIQDGGKNGGGSRRRVGGGGGGRQGGMSARNRELLALLPVALLVTAGFTAVFIVESNQIGDLSLIYGGYFLAVCLGVHLFIRARLAVRGPVPVPALRAARGDRPRDAVSDQRHPGPEAGVDLRRRSERCSR